nr:lipid A deacylase LpxR family protein [Pleionea sp. CnH1-48]
MVPAANLVDQSEEKAVDVKAAALFGSVNSEKNPHRGWIWDTDEEPWDTGWALYFDNDLFALRSSDQDYTGGLSVTLAGRRATEYWFSLDPLLTQVNNVTGLTQRHSGHDRQLHSFEVGFTVFTPEDIKSTAAQMNDRPYASLLYLSNTHESIDFENDSAWVSTLTLGVLGAPVVSNIQSGLHKVLGGDKPVGWDNQISEGGELTFRYSVARQNLFYGDYDETSNVELSTATQASVGYISEISWGLAGRVGQFNSPWYSFRPQFNDYSEKSASLVGVNQSSEEFYFWGGFNLHLRAYNSFLQGQFKDSPVTYSSHDVRPIIADVWAGVTRQFESGWRFSYLLRMQSSEVKSGKADRNVVWGGFIVSNHW